MSTDRLEERLGPVDVGGIARLIGYEIRFHKLSTDGTGKTDVVPANGQETWGVIFRLTQPQLDALRGFEVGYKEIEASVLAGVEAVSVRTYVAEAKTIRRGIRPTREYLSYLIAGAREHGLPTRYVEMLERVEVAEPSRRTLRDG